MARAFGRDRGGFRWSFSVAIHLCHICAPKPRIPNERVLCRLAMGGYKSERRIDRQQLLWQRESAANQNHWPRGKHINDQEHDACSQPCGERIALSVVIVGAGGLGVG